MVILLFAMAEWECWVQVLRDFMYRWKDVHVIWKWVCGNGQFIYKWDEIDSLLQPYKVGSVAEMKTFFLEKKTRKFLHLQIWGQQASQNKKLLTSFMRNLKTEVDILGWYDLRSKRITFSELQGDLYLL